jgi:hypothetical protein
MTRLGSTSTALASNNTKHHVLSFSGMDQSLAVRVVQEQDLENLARLPELCYLGPSCFVVFIYGLVQARVPSLVLIYGLVQAASLGGR